MTPEQFEIIRHSLGVDEYGEGNSNRDHFATDETCKDGIACESLVSLGFMSAIRNHPMIGGMTYYQVTANGRRAFFANCPKRPKKTRAQLRYQEWIEADSGLRFFEWLKSRSKVPT